MLQYSDFTCGRSSGSPPFYTTIFLANLTYSRGFHYNHFSKAPPGTSSAPDLSYPKPCATSPFSKLSKISHPLAQTELMTFPLTQRYVQPACVSCLCVSHHYEPRCSCQKPPEASLMHIRPSPEEVPPCSISTRTI